MEIKIEKLDNKGRGIGYVDGKIIFIPKALLNEIVDVKITANNKKYYEGEITEIITTSPERKESKCKYFDKCGGCNLLNLDYDRTLSYKESKIKEIFLKFLNIELNDITLINGENNVAYRNKITLHIENSVVGLISENNNILKINKCLMISDGMNEILLYVKSLNIKNGKVLLRENNKKEILISIMTEDKVILNIIPSRIKGIIFNDKVLYGKTTFIEEVEGYKFQVSYNSFFQINRKMTSKLFQIINDNIEGENVLDLYCGVGTLGISVAKKSKKVIGIDNLKSNIEDALYNKRINKIKNIDFILGDASVFKNETFKIDTVIVDPPRSGLNEYTLDGLLKNIPSKILYVSCNPFTLARDLKRLLDRYELKKYYLLDMFPWTHHIESVCVLKLK